MQLFTKKPDFIECQYKSNPPRPTYKHIIRNQWDIFDKQVNVVLYIGKR